MAAKLSQFTPAEVERIIKACVKNGVVNFETPGLKLRFGGSSENAVSTGQIVPPPNHEKQARESLEVDELLEREERLAMLVIEDPAEFERQLTSDDLMEEDEEDELQSE